MLTTYLIDNTSGTLSFTIGPGELDGPGGTQRHSDMRLYGNGALRWGEGMDENVLRLAETFACPRKVLGDYNPSTGANDFDTNTQRIRPKDEVDLGAGMGITQPLNGQVWYDTDTKKLYVYDEPNDVWVNVYQMEVGDATPGGIRDKGEFWYDTSKDFNQCAGILNLPQLKIYDKDHPDNEDGWVSVSQNYLARHGDWMAGILDMGGTTGYYANGCIDCVSDNDEQGYSGFRIVNLGDPICKYDAANKLYVDQTGNQFAQNLQDLAQVLYDHLQRRAGAVPTLDTTVTINNQVFDFTDNLHLYANEEQMLYSYNNVFTQGNNTRTPVQIGTDLHTINDRLDRVNGGTMESWLTLYGQKPGEHESWKAVPVKMLTDYVATKIAPYERKILYWDEYAVSVGGIGSGPLTIRFNFAPWIQDYRSQTGDLIWANQFRVVAIVYNRNFLMTANTQHAYITATRGAGSLGDYPYVLMHSKITDISKPTDSAGYTIDFEVGSQGYSPAWSGGGQTFPSYSTGTPSSWHFVLLGGKNEDMVRYRNIK